MNYGDLIDRLETWGVEDGVTLFRDGSFGFGFSIKPIDISCLSDDGINRMKHSIKTLLDSIPKETDIQFVQMIDRGAESDIKKHLALANNAPPLIRSLTLERAEKFEKLDIDGYVTTPRRIDIYEDLHLSGLHPGREFERMCSDIINGKIGVVMLDRRNPMLDTLNDMLSFYKFVETKEIRFISVNEKIDSIRWHSTWKQTMGGAR